VASLSQFPFHPPSFLGRDRHRRASASCWPLTPGFRPKSVSFKLCRRPADRLYPTYLVVYANEQYVGAAIRESGLARQDLWITSKYDGGDVLEAVHTSLQKVSGHGHFHLFRGSF
jgi:hypothetical protein